MRVIQKALTFDDVLLIPAHSSVLPRDVSLQTKLTRNITLNIPLVSAAMDTVTEARLAIALAQEGGIGIVHKNLTAQQQAAEVAKVKRFESGILKDPITIPPTMTVREVLTLTRTHKFSGLPVVEGDKVIGIVTNRDTRFETNLDQPVAAIMTPQAATSGSTDRPTKDMIASTITAMPISRLNSVMTRGRTAGSTSFTMVCTCVKPASRAAAT